MQDKPAEYKPLATPVSIYNNPNVAQPVCFKPGGAEAACFVPEVVELG
jgi:hypothetical protein